MSLESYLKYQGVGIINHGLWLAHRGGATFDVPLSPGPEGGLNRESCARGRQLFNGICRYKFSREAAWAVTVACQRECISGILTSINRSILTGTL